MLAAPSFLWACPACFKKGLGAAQRTALGCLDALRMHGANVDEALASLAAHKKRVQLLPGDSQPDDEGDWEGGGETAPGDFL